MSHWLLDTGPIVAYLEAADPHHGEVADILDAFHGRLVTSGAVIAEAMYLLGDTPRGPKHLAEFVGSSDLQVYDLAQATELREAAELTEKYADTPMDYADATLVLLAEALRLDTVLTLDRRGFATCRTRHRRSLKLALPPARRWSQRPTVQAPRTCSSRPSSDRRCRCNAPAGDTRTRAVA